MQKTKKRENKMFKARVSLPRNEFNQAQATVLLEAAKYYAKNMMSARMANTLKVKIHVRKTVCKKNTYGQVHSLVTGSKGQKDFLIELNANLDVHSMLDTLAHEMIHVKQLATKQLQYRYWKSDNQLHARWEGQEVGTVGSIPYAERPWEVEARNNQRLYYKSFVDFVKTNGGK